MKGKEKLIKIQWWIKYKVGSNREKHWSPQLMCQEYQSSLHTARQSGQKEKKDTF